MADCLYCGKPLPTPTRGVQKYCSSECKRLARNKRVRDMRVSVCPPKVRECRECGKDFLAKRINQIFCSQKCKDKYHGGRIKDRTTICLICGKEFIATHKGPALYCGDECRNVAKRQYYDNYHIRLHPCATPDCPHKTRNRYCWWCKEKRNLISHLK